MGRTEAEGQTVGGSAGAAIGLEVVGLECVRRDRVLFSDLSFSVVPGELVQVEGANGSGKTSLLRILCGLATPAAGEIRWEGKEIGAVWHQFVDEMAYVGHVSGIKGDFTPYENIKLARELGRTRNDMSVAGALERVGLNGFGHVPARTLSAGQQRRVALARLLVSKARIWILDEPFTALDVKGVQWVEEVLSEHLEAGGMLVFTTHQAARIRSMHSTSLKLGAA